MKFHDLDTEHKKNRTRSGRGISAGRGKTAGRGTKGQNSRTGGGVRLGFEGGQSPLAARLPKLKGFKSIKPKAQNVTTAQLNNLSGTVTNESLAESGLIANAYSPVKIIVSGDVDKKLTVKVQSASKAAIAAIEKAGGSFTATQAPKREKTSKKSK